MSEIEHQYAGDDSRDSVPVVGLVTAAGSGNETAGQILRAYRHGHDVIVTAGDNEPLEGLEFARQLGATVISPEPADREQSPREALVDAARDAGYPGLLYLDDLTEPVDFDRSLYALQETERYAVAAETGNKIAPAPEILVAIPAYNEAATIATVVATARRYGDAVLVVDDGSTDETSTAAEDAGATVHRHGTNGGYGAALQTAFEEARDCGADHLVVIDGDGQHNPEDIPKFVDALEQSGADIAIGCRYGDQADTTLPLYRQVGLSVTNVLTNLSMGMIRPRSQISDTQCGFRCFDRTAIESLATASDIDSSMGASTDILHHARINDLDLTEVETTVDYSVDGANNYNPVHHGVVLIMNLLRTIEHERPITTLGLPGILFALVGFGFGYWTVLIYVQDELFPIAHAIASSFFILAGIFMAFTGIILHAMHTHIE
jgi:glycosyltransferase involved in cell wall biosynthesis